MEKPGIKIAVTVISGLVLTALLGFGLRFYIWYCQDVYYRVQPADYGWLGQTVHTDCFVHNNSLDDVEQIKVRMEVDAPRIIYPYSGCTDTTDEISEFPIIRASTNLDWDQPEYISSERVVVTGTTKTGLAAGSTLIVTVHSRRPVEVSWQVNRNGERRVVPEIERNFFQKVASNRWTGILVIFGLGVIGTTVCYYLMRRINALAGENTELQKILKDERELQSIATHLQQAKQRLQNLADKSTGKKPRK